jgi:hypothetical protein
LIIGEFMDNTFKILITIIIVLIVLVFISDTNNNTLVTYPSLISITSNQATSNSNQISPNEAISIVNGNIPAFGQVRYAVQLIQNGQNPYYLVKLYGNDPGVNNYGQVIAVSKVDARTGHFLGTTV